MRTIRAKLVFLLVVIFGLTLSVFSGVLYYLYARQSAQNFDLNLSNDALAIVGMVKGDSFLEQEIISGLIHQPLQAAMGTNRYVQVLSISGDVIIRSANLKGVNLPVSADVLTLALSQHQVFQTLDKKTTQSLIGEGRLRMVTYPVFEDGMPRYLVQVAANTQPLDKSMFQLRLLLLISVPLAIFAAALGGTFIAKKAFDPIDRIVRTAQSISAEHLDKRLEAGKVDDEVTRLSNTLNAMFDRIEEAFRLQKQFTADASHELKTPLTILLGEMEVALSNPRTSRDYVDTLKSAVEEIRRINKIVDELLTIARLESGQLQMQRQPVRLDELLLDAVSKTSGYASQRSININFEVLDRQAEETREVLVEGDEGKLLSVFINLLDNAIKYSGGSDTIRVVLRSDDSTATVQIIDKGIGIDAEDLPHVFDRFYRADKARSSDGSKRGTGLGLAISKSLVEAHGGRVQIISEKGAGTTVTINLPILNQAVGGTNESEPLSPES